MRDKNKDNVILYFWKIKNFNKKTIELLIIILYQIYFIYLLYYVPKTKATLS